MILPNLYDVRTKAAREILAELRRKFRGQLADCFINFNTKLREGAAFGQPITEYDPASTGCRDFVRLAREVIARGGREAAPVSLLRQADEIAARAEQLLATSQTLFGPVPQGPGPDQAPGTPQTIERKVTRIYGPQQGPDGVLFRTLTPGAAKVELAGDFNGWRPEASPMVPDDEAGDFSVRLPLPPGRYLYRLVVDGRWQQDPCNDRVELNPYGELNSVVEVTE